jgi:hypothetical protein
VATFACALLAANGSADAAAQQASSKTTTPSASEWMNEAYRRKASRDPAGATSAFELARAAGFDSQLVGLELGYLALQSGERETARSYFEAVAVGPDPARAAQAKSELRVLPSHAWGDFYADTYSWDRVAGGNPARDAVPTFRIRAHYRPFLGLDFSLYLVAQVTRDLASRGQASGGVSQIYADNYALFGPGVLLRLFDRHLGLFFQAGPAVNLLNDRRQRVTFDARGGAFFGIETSRCWPAAEAGAVVAFIPCADIYSDLIYVRRFDHNIIGFGRGRAGATWLLTGPVAWQLVGEARGSVDRNSDFYNNFVEGGIGPRWRLLRPFQLELFASINAGRYLGRENRDPAPHPLSYFDLRLQAATYVEF